MAVLELSAQYTLVTLACYLGSWELKNSIFVLTRYRVFLLSVLHLPQLNDSVISRKNLEGV